MRSGIARPVAAPNRRRAAVTARGGRHGSRGRDSSTAAARTAVREPAAAARAADREPAATVREADRPRAAPPRTADHEAAPAFVTTLRRPHTCRPACQSRTPAAASPTAPAAPAVTRTAISGSRNATSSPSTNASTATPASTRLRLRARGGHPAALGGTAARVSNGRCIDNLPAGADPFAPSAPAPRLVSIEYGPPDAGRRPGRGCDGPADVARRPT